MNYKIAELSQEDYDAIKKAEAQIKSNTGKDFVMIAWEKNKR